MNSCSCGPEGETRCGCLLVLQRLMGDDLGVGSLLCCSNQVPRHLLRCTKSLQPCVRAGARVLSMTVSEPAQAKTDHFNFQGACLAQKYFSEQDLHLLNPIQLRVDFGLQAEIANASTLHKFESKSSRP